MLSIIKPRGDIKSNWDSANPVLRMREWGVEWDTTVGVGDVKIKIGDGVTPWSALDYVIVSDVTKKIVKTFAEVTAENPELTENSAMDVLWATAKKKFEYLNTKVTDISENGDIDLTKVNIPTFTEYTESTLPDARTAITNITAGIKMPAFISNAKAALKGLVTLGEMRSLLVNSGLTTETGKYFLDAAYGKTLADQISQLNSTTNALGKTSIYSIPKPDVHGEISSLSTWQVIAIKQGNTVFLRLNFNGRLEPTTGFVELFTLPSDCIPMAIVILNYVTQNGMPATLTINSEGKVSFYNPGTAAIPSSDWLCRQYITYIATQN